MKADAIPAAIEPAISQPGLTLVKVISKKQASMTNHGKNPLMILLQSRATVAIISPAIAVRTPMKALCR